MSWWMRETWTWGHGLRPRSWMLLRRQRHPKRRRQRLSQQRRRRRYCTMWNMKSKTDFQLLITTTTYRLDKVQWKAVCSESFRSQPVLLRKLRIHLLTGLVLVHRSSLWQTITIKSFNLSVRSAVSTAIKLGCTLPGQRCRSPLWWHEPCPWTLYWFGVYHHSYPENGVIQLLARDVRPRARTVYQWHQLEPGMVVMVNYNPDDPKERGYWYDAEIQKRRETRTVREVYAKILLG